MQSAIYSRLALLDTRYRQRGMAAGYGVESRRTDDPEELREALREAIASDKPRLVETRVAPGMALA